MNVLFLLFGCVIAVNARGKGIFGSLDQGQTKPVETSMLFSEDPRLFGSLGQADPRRTNSRTGELNSATIVSYDTKCPDDKVDGQIYQDAAAHFLCNRYEDGSSYAEIVSCNIGELFIAVGHSLGAFACTKQGRTKNGKFGYWGTPYPLRGEQPVFNDITDRERDSLAFENAADNLEAATAAAAAQAALAASRNELQPQPQREPSEVEVQPATDKPDQPELECNKQGVCYFPVEKPDIKLPNPGSKIPEGNPDCSELTQDCYFPFKPKPAEISTTTVSAPGAIEVLPPTPKPLESPPIKGKEPVPWWVQRPKRKSTCSFNGKKAKIGQKFIVGELYVLQCKRVGSRSELRFIGCATSPRSKRVNNNYQVLGEALLKLFVPRSGGAKFECRGEFVPNQLTVEN